MENFEEKGIQINDDLQLKILLELAFAKEQFKLLSFTAESVKNDKKIMKNIADILKEVDKEISSVFSKKLDAKTKAMYLKLKESNFDKNLIEVAKYL